MTVPGGVCRCKKRLHRSKRTANRIADKLGHRVYDCPTGPGWHTTSMDAKSYVKSLYRYARGPK